MRFLGLAAFTYGAFYYVVNRLIFQPTRYPGGWWHTQTDLGAHDVWLETRDRVRLHAWWVESPDSRLATLFFHGNAANLAHSPGHLQQICAAGSSVLIVDYRGYGKSEGRPTERGLYRDADAAYDYLVRLGYAPGQIVVQGESMGSAVAADLASRRCCAGLVLECPFTSYAAIASTIVPVLPRLFASGFRTRHKVARVKAPLLVIHGDRDRTVPCRMGRKVFEAGNEPKWFWRVDGAGHADIVETAGLHYGTRLREFYRALKISL